MTKDYELEVGGSILTYRGEPYAVKLSPHRHAHSNALEYIYDRDVQEDPCLPIPTSCTSSMPGTGPAELAIANIMYGR